MTPKTMLSDESQQQIEPGEVLEEAVLRYAAACRLERFADKTGQRACDKGIREEDVPRLVEEVRRENAERGRQVLRVTADTNILVSGLVYRARKAL